MTTRQLYYSSPKQHAVFHAVHYGEATVAAGKQIIANYIVSANLLYILKQCKVGFTKRLRAPVQQKFKV